MIMAEDAVVVETWSSLARQTINLRVVSRFTFTQVDHRCRFTEISFQVLRRYNGMLLLLIYQPDCTNKGNFLNNLVHSYPALSRYNMFFF